MEPVCIAVDGIIKLIENLKLSSSAGFDNTNLKVLRNTKLVSCEVLSMLFEETLMEDSLLMDWKIGIIIVSPKKVTAGLFQTTAPFL